jgi:peptide/nickel transport system ATP-binding protein
MSTSPILSIDRLTVSYGSVSGALQAVRDVSIEIERGEAVALVGESGSGKSTIASAVLDLLGSGGRLEAGTIAFEGRDLSRLTHGERRGLLGNRIGAVFQDPFTSLNPSLRVGLQIAEPLIQHRGLSRKAAISRARELLAETGISRTADVVRAYPHQLSGGMKQRALIAAALACEPALIVLDEPTTALDVTIEAQILDLLEELRERHRLSMLFISHNLAVVRRLCDRVYVLYAGQVVEHGSVEALFQGPSHPYTKGLFASLPRINERGRERRLAPIPGSLPSLVALPEGCVFHPRCPYVEDRCRSEAQTLSASGATVTRCWKSRSVRQLAWPTAARSAEPGKNVREPLLEVTKLSKRFVLGSILESLRLNRGGKGRWPLRVERRVLTAVDQVSIRIFSGEVLGLVGESGCGKSTLGRCILRLIEPSQGEIRFAGQTITGRSEAQLRDFRRSAQIIFQNPDSSLNPRMTVGEILARPLELFGLARGREAARRVEELLELVRLSPRYARRYPHQLSGGEKQRVGIARALASEPRFIVCDEAVSALDVSVQAAILNLLADLRDRLNLALLFISHDLSVVAHIADRIAVMYSGAICEVGSTEEILHPPYHPYTQALLSAAPQLGLTGAGAIERIRLPGSVAEHTGATPQCRFHPRCPVKLGEICERADPPALRLPGGHTISCHHPLETLRKLRSVLPAEAHLPAKEA